MTQTDKVAKALNDAGFTAKKVAELEYSTDGQVDIVGTKIHVQVGPGYLGLVRENDNNTFTFYDERQKVEDIITDVRDALSTMA